MAVDRFRAAFAREALHRLSEQDLRVRQCGRQLVHERLVKRHHPVGGGALADVAQQGDRGQRLVDHPEVLGLANRLPEHVDVLVQAIEIDDQRRPRRPAPPQHGVEGTEVVVIGTAVVTRTNEVVRSPETVRPRERAPAARRSAAGAKRRQGTVPIERVLKGAAKKYDVDVITNASLALSRPAAKTVERTADKLFGVIEAAPGRQQVKVGLKRDALVFDVSRLAKEDAGRAVRALTQSKAPRPRRQEEAALIGDQLRALAEAYESRSQERVTVVDPRRGPPHEGLALLDELVLPEASLLDWQDPLRHDLP